MQWSDDGIVISARRHGETSVIVTLLTRAHGRHTGLVRGGAGRRARGVYQPGNLVAADWRARLAEHLGNYRCELMRAYAAELLDDKLPLLALESASALIDAALPEREPHGELFARHRALLEALTAPGWEAVYVRWELDLLAELGFGLDLTACAATGTTDDLAYVSPRTGRAVSAAAAEPYRDRLLTLPPFLAGKGGAAVTVGAAAVTPDDIRAGLDLTGYFLSGHVFAAAERRLPPSRGRLLDGLVRG